MKAGPTVPTYIYQPEENTHTHTHTLKLRLLIEREKKNQQEKQHFSHHHALIPLVLDVGEEINCNGCETLIQEPFHGCLSCNYFLHDSCLNTPRFLQHPSHPHPLTLLPTPTYPTQAFTCNACVCEGKSFSLSCAQCECDLHLQCAALPETLRIVDKHDHVLKLIFGSPSPGKDTIFTCDLCCKSIYPEGWLYYCADCDYGVHLVCTELIKNKQDTTNIENQEAAVPEKSEDLQNSIYEVQRRMKEQHIRNKMALEALDNASDYVGSSYKRYDYYY